MRVTLSVPPSVATPPAPPAVTVTRSKPGPGQIAAQLDVQHAGSRLLVISRNVQLTQRKPLYVLFYVRLRNLILSLGEFSIGPAAALFDGGERSEPESKRAAAGRRRGNPTGRSAVPVSRACNLWMHWPLIFVSLLRQENETAAPAQGAAVARASSFSPRTVFLPVRSPA